MDLSALIFVALAVAWAVYLIPKALKHHEESADSRPVDGFSDRLRVLARREPVDRRTSRLVVTPGRPSSAAVPVVEHTEEQSAEQAPEATAAVPARRLTPVQARARRAAAARAAKRRLRVVGLILITHLVVIVLAATSVVSWAHVAIPVVVLVAWLVACRLMVTKERAALAPRVRRPQAESSMVEAELGDEPTASEGVAEDEPLTEEIAAVSADAPEAPAPAAPAASAPGGWDPMPVTLPTYVGKEPAARRSVRTIDLDSTGVWTSGRSAIDSAIAREADEAAKSARASESQADEAARRRAAGS